MSFWWKDTNLWWDEATFGVQEAAFPTDRIWTPQIYLLNTADHNFMYLINSSVVSVRRAQVSSGLGGKFETSCELNLLYFPFDSQTCEIHLTTLYYSSEQLLFTPIIPNISLGTRKSRSISIDRKKMVENKIQKFASINIPQKNAEINRQSCFFSNHMVSQASVIKFDQQK